VSSAISQVTLAPRRPEDARNAKVLIHSPAGNGKTSFLGSAQLDPRTFPMAFLNWDAGESSLAGLDIDVFDIKDAGDFDAVYRELKKPNSPYKSVGVDSITETQINTLFQILELDQINRADPDQLAQQDWGIILVRMRRIVRQFFKMLPMHVFMTALSKDEVVARVGTVRAPAVQGGFAHELPGIPDVVAYLALENIEPDDAHPEGERRVLLLHSNPKFSVKCRTPWGGSVPAEIVDPTVTKLLDALGY
jgi:hypothetical protein